MRALGVPFVIHVADIDERNGKGEPPDALVARLSREKAQAVARLYPDAIVVGADTIVTLDGQLLGKPAGPGDAAEMLRRLRDRPHDVYSGVTVYPPGGAEPKTVVVGSTVWMRPYTDDEIAAYVVSGDPLDKAGAYAIQNAAFHPVSRMQGCYASVMGLPLCALDRLLAEVGIMSPPHPNPLPPGRGKSPPARATEACVSLTGVTCCGGERVAFDLEQ
jgi:MAF protein